MSEMANTGGGPYIGGGVDTGGGTFIGRDQIIVINGYSAEQLEIVLARLREMLADPQAVLQKDVAKARLTIAAPGAPTVTLSDEAAGDLLPAAARQADEAAYLTAIQVNPRYGRWARQFVPLAGTLTTAEHPPGFDIQPEYSKLDIVGEGVQRQIRRIQLADITEATAHHPALALLGEPGAGKTTTLYRLLLDAARAKLAGVADAVPLLLPLAEYRDYRSPHDFLEAKWRQAVGTPHLAERLHQGKLLLLCDALNEMPAHGGRDRRERTGEWRRFVEEWPGNRMLFTCRSRDYSEPLGLPQVEIEPLDDPRIQDFLSRHLPPEQADSTWRKLAGTPLLKLARNPYYLTMLALLVAKGGGWPTSRATLFHGFVGTLLERERWRNHPDWPGERALRQALAALAETMQPSVGVARSGEGTRLPRQEALQCLPPVVSTPDGLVETPPATVVRLGLSATLLDVELAADGNEYLRFYHHQLQDYFCACALLHRFRAGQDLSSCWLQPRRIGEMPDPGPLRPDEALPPPPPTGWEEPTLLAASLAPNPAAFIDAVRRVNPTLAARCLRERGAPDAATANAAQQDLLRLMSDPKVHLRARLAAGEALGWLGDPRFEAVEVDGRRVLLPPLVAIPAGPFCMGSGRWEVWRLGRQGFSARDELPRHRVQVPAFAIGQYPVTNAEFACFIAGGGYEDGRWWTTESARRWRRGELESDVVEDVMNAWRTVKADPTLPRRQGWSAYSIAQWEKLIEMDEVEFRKVVTKQQAERAMDRPGFWDDARLNNPAQPVVGVTWFEAWAYCAWLEACWRAADSRCSRPLAAGEGVRLPTEAEWEKAARTPANGRYPWGDRWAADRANTAEGQVLRPSPVGVYPAGATAAGVHDLSGNVWEWTASHDQAYPYDANDDRNNREINTPFVVRGGSWSSDRRNARAAYRGGDLPDYFDDVLGFRVVVSLANSEF
ncbi:MAG: SUMF1/EgtB/PvdO family nonheme iron enzyme [Candidatus Contendobacter sp.]|nr:SUMF1/EgtB/PvdO family nonheme iron enzyme [Candidatus Contendobacter sp.]MDS4059430.1 SUMF1/EgtB/PvdO family nonheme iron enzyme [Candidatus Contendobacter sp.]